MDEHLARLEAVENLMVELLRWGIEQDPTHWDVRLRALRLLVRDQEAGRATPSGQRADEQQLRALQIQLDLFERCARSRR